MRERPRTEPVTTHPQPQEEPRARGASGRTWDADRRRVEREAVETTLAQLRDRSSQATEGGSALHLATVCHDVLTASASRGGDVGAVASGIVKAAVQYAETLSMERSEAASVAVRTCIDAAQSRGQRALVSVWKALMSPP